MRAPLVTPDRLCGVKTSFCPIQRPLCSPPSWSNLSFHSQHISAVASSGTNEAGATSTGRTVTSCAPGPPTPGSLRAGVLFTYDIRGSNSWRYDLPTSRVPRGVCSRGTVLSFSCANTKVMNVLDVKRADLSSRSPGTHQLPAEKKAETQLCHSDPFTGRPRGSRVLLCRCVSSAWAVPPRLFN